MVLISYWGPPSLVYTIISRVTLHSVSAPRASVFLFLGMLEGARVDGGPLRTIARTIGSLIATLGLPSRSTGTGRILNRVDFPRFDHLLPCHSCGRRSNLFVGSAAVNFVLRTVPVGKTGRSVIRTLSRVLHAGLPHNVPLYVRLVSDRLINSEVRCKLHRFS